MLNERVGPGSTGSLDPPDLLDQQEPVRDRQRPGLACVVRETALARGDSESGRETLVLSKSSVSITARQAVGQLAPCHATETAACCARQLGPARVGCLAAPPPLMSGWLPISAAASAQQCLTV